MIEVQAYQNGLLSDEELARELKEITKNYE